MPCRHCQQLLPIDRRGLCRACYRTPGIREEYECLDNSGSPVPTVSSGPLPAEPTTALPGTEDKLKVLSARALRGESLFHPADVRVSRSGRDIIRILALLAHTGDD